MRNTFGIPSKGESEQSFIWVDNSAGSVGGTGFIRDFSTVIEKKGDAIQYIANHGVLGDRFIIMQDGVYAMSYCDTNSANPMYIGISRDELQSTTSTDIQSIGTSYALTTAFSATNSVTACSATIWCKAGTVIRARNGSQTGTEANLCKFIITKVG